LTFNAGTLGGKVATAVAEILKTIKNLFRNVFQFSYPLGIGMQKYIFVDFLGADLLKKLRGES
jgi:hypothetical protein